jgi:hypothetical protein
MLYIPLMFRTPQVEVLVNPSEHDIIDFARDDSEQGVRTLTDVHDNLFVWKSGDAIHGQIAKALEGKMPGWEPTSATVGGNEWFVAKRVAPVFQELIARGRQAARRGATDPQKHDAAPLPLYVFRPLLNIDDFAEWAEDNGFKSMIDDPHVTVLYSKQPVDWAAMGESTDQVIVKGGVRSVGPLGDQGAVVLHFTAPDIAARHNEDDQARCQSRLRRLPSAYDR